MHFCAETTRADARQKTKARRKPMSTLHRPTVQPSVPSTTQTPTQRPFKLIGELINSSFARAARAWKNRDVAAYARLAKLQADLGADYLTLNIDGTQSMRVTPQDMYCLLYTSDAADE